MSGGTQSPPLQGKANQPMGQTAPGKNPSSVIPDIEQRADIFDHGKPKSAESGTAQNMETAKLDEAIESAKNASRHISGK